MRYVTYRFSFLFFVLVWLLNGCKCQRDDSQANPCTGKKPTGATFNTYENTAASFGANYFPEWIRYASDTVTDRLSAVDIEALDEQAISYLWTIGANTYTTQKVTVNFESRPVGQNVIPITLKIKKKSHNDCFPSDTGSMTMNRLLVISDTTLVYGNFKGVKTDTLGHHKSDSFTVFIDAYYPLVQYDLSHHPQDTIITLYINNLYPGCETVTPYHYYAVGYKEIVFEGGTGNNCNNLGGTAQFNSNTKELEIRFYYYNSQTFLQEDYIFKGKRIP